LEGILIGSIPLFFSFNKNQFKLSEINMRIIPGESIDGINLVYTKTTVDEDKQHPQYIPIQHISSIFSLLHI
jgi:hypothetical protein